MHKAALRLPQARTSRVFSLDATVHLAHRDIDFIKVKGKFSYSSELNIVHGDILAITPDIGDQLPDQLVVTSYHDAYFIRYRRQIDAPFAQRRELYLVGSDGSRQMFKIIGLVCCVFRMLD